MEGFTSKYHRQQQFTLKPFTFQILALSLFTKIQSCPFDFRLSWAKVTWSYLSNSCQIFPVFSCFNASLILFAKHFQCLNRPASSTTLTLAGMTPWLRKAMYFPKDLTSLLMLWVWWEVLLCTVLEAIEIMVSTPVMSAEYLRATKRALTDLQGQTVGTEIANVFTCFTNPVNTSEINPQSEKAT